MARLLQPSFTSGELSPSLYARVDIARYQTALRRAINFIVRPTGGIDNRPGLYFVNRNRQAAKRSRLIPFVPSDSEAYAIELADHYARFVTNGAVIVSGTLTVSNVDSSGGGTPKIRVTTSVAHGLSTGASVSIAGVVGVNSPLRANGDFIVTVTAADKFTLDGSDWTGGSYTSGGTVSVHLQIATPWAEADLAQVRYTQSADVLTLFHPDYAPRQITRVSSTSFTIATYEPRNGPFKATNADESIYVYASGTEGSVTLTASSGIFTSDMVGALFYLEEQDPRAVPPWESDKQLTATGVSTLGLLRRSDGKVYECATAYTPGSGKECRTGTVRPTHEEGTAADGDGNPIKGTSCTRAGVDWTYLHSGYGILEITAYTSSTQVTATVLNTLPESVVGGSLASASWSFNGDGVTTVFSITGATATTDRLYEVYVNGENVPFTAFTTNSVADTITFDTAPSVGTGNVVVSQIEYSNKSNIWALGAWSEEEGYPSLGTYYGERLATANTPGQPQTVWTTKVGIYDDYGKSTPLADDDALTFTLAARRLQAVRDLLPLDQLLAITSSAEWKVTAGSNDVLTPSTVGFKQQGEVGAADVQSVIAGNDAIYVQNRGALVRAIRYSFDAGESGGYRSRDLTMLSAHLVEGYEITELAFALVPYKVLWAVRSDGVLLGCTYEPDQEVVGWHRHTTAAGGEFESICVIPEGDEDVLYGVVRRTIDGAEVRYIERLVPRWKESDDIEDAFFVDSGLSFDGRNTGSTTMAVTGSGWTVNDDLTMTASVASFASTDEGDELELTVGGDTVRFEVLAYLTTTTLTVRPLINVPVGLQAVATTDWAWRRDTFSGLDHLVGETVAVLADGAEQSSKVVDEDGAITLDRPAARVHAGLGYNADAELLDITVVGGETVRDRPKLVKKLKAILNASRGGKAGPDEDNLDELKQREQGDAYNTQAPVSGVYEAILPSSTWNANGRAYLRQDRPLPFTVLGVIPEVEFGGR